MKASKPCSLNIRSEASLNNTASPSKANLNSSESLVALWDGSKVAAAMPLFNAFLTSAALVDKKRWQANAET